MRNRASTQEAESLLTRGEVSALITRRERARMLVRREVSFPGAGEVALLAALQARLGSASEITLSSHHAPLAARQVRERMATRGLTDLDDYLRLVDDAPEERALLREGLLLGSTRFFRDADVFEALAGGALQALFRAHEGTLKVWIAGCSTGEEAYSMAMLLRELLDARGDARPVRVFATDVRESAVAHGRRGVYPERACAHIAPHRLARFFERVEGGYRVVASVRDQIVWGRHDLTRDPPFPAIDLLSCRNVLVYFERAAQARILARLHFALRPSGLLLLGSAESTRAVPRMFEPIVPSIRLYGKRCMSLRDVVAQAGAR